MELVEEKVMARVLVGICVVSFVLLIFSTTTVFSQNTYHGLEKLDKNKPSVFLSFERKVRSREQCSFKDLKTWKEQEMYRLRLYNNTSSLINIDAGYGADEPLTKVKGPNGQIYDVLPVGAKVDSCYQVDSMTAYVSGKGKHGGIETEVPTGREVPKIDFSCSCRSKMSAVRAFNSKGLWIPSGGYVVFDVPQEYLSKGLQIYTLFNYEWEFDSAGLHSNEPHHQVFFYSSDIP